MHVFFYFLIINIILFIILIDTIILLLDSYSMGLSSIKSLLLVSRSEITECINVFNLMGGRTGFHFPFSFHSVLAYSFAISLSAFILHLFSLITGMDFQFRCPYLLCNWPRLHFIHVILVYNSFSDLCFIKFIFAAFLIHFFVFYADIIFLSPYKHILCFIKIYLVHRYRILLLIIDIFDIC